MPSFTVQSVLILLPFFLSTANAHGYITSPQARVPGQQLSSLCGNQIYNNQAADTYGNIQGELQVAGTSFDPSKCNLWLCKGFQFADQPASNIQQYTAGQTVPIHFDIRAPHDGTANVSIVDTASNSVISELKSFAQYALTSRPIQKNETDFDVTIPSDLSGKCTQAGECVIQMYWDARSIDQTYESCIDFVVGGSGEGNDAASSGVVSSESTTTARSTTTAASASNTVSRTSSASVVVTGGTTSANHVASSTSSKATSMSVTSAAASTLAVPTGDIYTLTAGATTMLCHEEL